MANGIGTLPTAPTGDAPIAPRESLRLAPRPKPPVSVFTPNPDQVATWRRLAAVVADSDTFDRGAYDASYDAFRHHADRAFGEGDGAA